MPVFAGSGSEPGLHGRQPSEETPRQPRVVGQNDAPSFRNHGRYIALQAAKEKGPRARPFLRCTPNSRNLFLCRSSSRFLGGGSCGLAFGAGAACLGDARLLAAQPTQIIQLGTAHLTAAHDRD